MHERRHGHRNVELSPGREPELEVLSEQVTGERGREIEVDESRRLVAAEGGPHDAGVQKLEVVRPRDPSAFRQHCGLGHDLSDYAEDEVVAYLDKASTLAFADIADVRAEHTQVGEGQVEGVARSRDHDAEAGRPRSLRIAADRGG